MKTTRKNTDTRWIKKKIQPNIPTENVKLLCHNWDYKRAIPQLNSRKKQEKKNKAFSEMKTK